MTDEFSKKQVPINQEVAQFSDYFAEFSKAYYHTPVIGEEPPWKNLHWMGIPALKCPLDLWIYQEIICDRKPDFIVECGVAFGGTTAFLADICKLVGCGQIIGIDINLLDSTRTILSKYENIQLIEGNSVAPEIVEKVFKIVNNCNNILVILDSDHSKAHVLKELNEYSSLVPSQGYVIVEDTNINGNPVYPDFGEGPMEVVEEFLKINNDFYVDKNCHKFLSTFNPNGYLKRR
ncbi:MAG: CmcI family methyltransferase [Prochloraceae cyanobacterium]|nr:CmcI family methyltransferase [Prochloraceae cyanobacterium]